MKISEIAAYRELLESLRPETVSLVVQKEMDPILDIVAKHANQLPQHLYQVSQARDQAMQAITEFDRSLDRLLETLLEQIRAQESVYLARSYQLYEDGLAHDSIDHVLNRRFPIAPTTQAYIQSRVQAHSGWQWSGLLIRPGLENWIEHMVACDPLYVIDTNHDLLTPARQKFNPAYQARLRYYVIKESAQEIMLDCLPNEQFGFVLAYNFFHYKPFEIMRAYLREIYQKLSPGGVLAITFNDCDRRGAVELAERMMNCYTPGRMVLGLCEAVGLRSCKTIDWMQQ